MWVFRRLQNAREESASLIVCGRAFQSVCGRAFQSLGAELEKKLKNQVFLFF